MRHPGFVQLLDALARSVEISRGAERLHLRMEAGGCSTVPMTEAELEAFDAVLEVAMIWEYMPQSERVIVNAVLEHAGVPRLAA